MTRADLRFIEVTSAIRANSQPAAAQPELFMRAGRRGLRPVPGRFAALGTKLSPAA
jgi:hypothetical protein